MNAKRAILALMVILCGTAAYAEDVLPASLLGMMESCLTPVETYPYRLDRSDPLYETAREDHQRYLEEMEDYVNCLDRERRNALAELQSSFRLFRQNFGKDAVFRYQPNQ